MKGVLWNLWEGYFRSVHITVSVGLLFLSSILSVNADEYGDFIYSTNDGTVAIEYYFGPGGSVTIPDAILGFPVTTIKDSAFSYAGLTDLTIPGSVTSIGKLAFSVCTSLTNITIGAGVTNIGFNVFGGCYMLATITVDPLNLAYSSVDGVLFDESQKVLVSYPSAKSWNYNVPDGVTSIQSNAFRECSYLTNVDLPESLTSIGDTAFFNCYSLTSITIGNSVTNIGEQAFNYCVNLESVTLGTNVSSLRNSVFMNCSSLVSILIPESVTNLGSYAFGYCNNLTSITIPANLTGIDSEAFVGCDNFIAFVVVPENPVYSSMGGILFNKDQTTLILCPKSKTGTYVIPNNVTILAKKAFSGCTGLTNVIIPNGVGQIGDEAFGGCINIDKLIIPNSVTHIGMFAFQNCYSLTDLIIPESVIDIGPFAFYFCGLKSVTIQSSVTNLAAYSFAGCLSLTSITVPQTIISIGDGAFADCHVLEALYFQGDAPDLGSSVFYGVNNAIAYYLPRTTNWDSTFGGLPTALWKPAIQVGDAGFGIQTNQFGFNINWASGMDVVVEACTNLSEPIWYPVRTNTLMTGSSYFSDPEWTNYPGRYYRLRSP